ncbi:MAG: sigma-70 family RNA polymerase sigma factor [Proteobacteria bacterium]|nr:sigma-70 family RNA polymerase sigma factor [Pseudomonadota bacterium]
MGVDEADLIRESVNGDESAYELLLEQHLPSLTNYVMRMMANTAEADDIIQETFIRLWTHGQTFNPRYAKLTTWLHNIAHNLCIDHFRKHNRMIGEPTEQPDVEARGPEQGYIQQRQVRSIQEAMMALPEKQRSAIIMCHYQGLSNKDAAAVIEISIEALESLMARGRKKLKDILENEY